MPTFETLPRFTTDLQHLTPAPRRRFRRVVLGAFVPDLRSAGCQFRPGLRVKRVQRASGIYELTWSMGCCPGRATWEYGPARRPGTQHIIWRRIGTHDILTGP
ncbi:hypothetical protein ACFQFR_39465 [Streptomyces goshikiensis]